MSGSIGVGVGLGREILRSISLRLKLERDCDVEKGSSDG